MARKPSICDSRDSIELLLSTKFAICIQQMIFLTCLIYIDPIKHVLVRKFLFLQEDSLDIKTVIYCVQINTVG